MVILWLNPPPYKWLSSPWTALCLTHFNVIGDRKKEQLCVISLFSKNIQINLTPSYEVEENIWRLWVENLHSHPGVQVKSLIEQPAHDRGNKWQRKWCHAHRNLLLLFLTATHITVQNSTFNDWFIHTTVRNTKDWVEFKKFRLTVVDQLVKCFFLSLIINKIQCNSWLFPAFFLGNSN